jgi:hypothetical protein
MKKNVFHPSFLHSLRNVDEFPQGRPQPSTIHVSQEGVVVWRTMVRAGEWLWKGGGGACFLVRVFST